MWVFEEQRKEENQPHIGSHPSACAILGLGYEVCKSKTWTTKV